jgi:hypothetical protein
MIILTAPAFKLIIGTAERLRCRKQVACYLGLVPWRRYFQFSIIIRSLAAPSTWG